MGIHLLKCKVSGASVDWLTVTSSPGDKADSLWKLGNRVLNRGQREGQYTTRWHANGYSGHAQPHCSFGSREDGTCLVLRSFEAADHWKEALSAAENCSRLDLAVDCQLKLPVTSLASQIYRDVAHVPPMNGRPPQRRLIVSGEGGSTVYIGSRASEQMGRVYDKGVEQKALPAGLWWRWEVEYKGSRSYAIANTLPAIELCEVFIMATVATWFRQRSLHSFTSSTVGIVCNGPREPSSAEQSLQWLARGVRPTVQRLVDLVGRERVLSALGLTPQSAVPASPPLET